MHFPNLSCKLCSTVDNAHLIEQILAVQFPDTQPAMNICLVIVPNKCSMLLTPHTRSSNIVIVIYHAALKGTH